MISIEERQKLAHSLDALSNDLLAFRQGLVKDLPDELRKRTQANKFIQPMTSSGIEHIDKVLARLRAASFYLNDPSFPYPQQNDNPSSKADEEYTVEAPAAGAKSNKETKESTIKPELDFGPFDPRGNK